MVSAVTEGVQVSVEVTYQAEFSSPHQHHYVFTYKVTIENKSNQTVQLLRRKWEIFDAAESHKIIRRRWSGGPTTYFRARRITQLRFWVQS